jgi:hypothetical protein
MGFLREWRPKAAEALDAVDAQLSALDESAVAAETEIVVVSFGNPTNRGIANGYWDQPKEIPGQEGAEIKKIDATKGWGDVANIVLAGIAGTVLDATHARGPHGGYYSVTVAVVPGTTVVKASPVGGDETPVAISEPTPEPVPATRATVADLMAKFGRKK